ncbi:hypothetical protein [Providencia phage PSTCR2]|uniref:Uncharacterized protein n=1 Tax=Providencia phage PSTCR2 TaxID=2783544 RepID=A0A873WKP6_9CAUD|nr:hypothetical protein [Providencia phage PSTCR2]
MKTYGIINKQGQYIEVSTTIRGAKIHATKNGCTQVAYRHNSGHMVVVVAQKDRNNNWYSI